MFNFFKKIHALLIDSSYLNFILFSYFFIFIGYILPVELIEFIFKIENFNKNPVFEEFSGVSLLIIAVVVAPIIETAIFQILLIKGFFVMFYLFFDKLSVPKITILAIVVSSLLFGFSHYYSHYYMIMMFILGFFFGMIYFYSMIKKIKPFFPIVIVHSLYNITIIFFGFNL